MKYESLTVLIPSHSVEDLPLDLPESQAESLLNAFSVIWHPHLLASAGVKPQWERADSPPESHKNRLFIVPTVSTDWIPCQWVENAREQGAVVVTGVSKREEMIEQVLSPLELDGELDPDLTADFLAFGHCYLQLEILTRQMRYFNELDERRLEGESISAARSALAGDRPATQTHLRSCFEMLLEGRERFYPVDCYLADLCLLAPDMANEHWSRLVASGRTVNYLATIESMSQLAVSQPEAFQEFNKRWRNQEQDLIGGEWQETHNTLLPLEPVLASFQKGLREIDQLCGRRPSVWGRRTFGVGVQVPQILDKFEYHGALHFVIDDGLYPDEEQGKHRWEGCDGSVIDAVSRIPLAGDSAAGMLRFPQRMAEAMDYDHAALLILARWPELHTPWIEDFHRIHQYAPVLGRFVTFSDFFQTTESQGRMARHKAGDYLSPHLVQAVAREEPDPISRHIDGWRDYYHTTTALWTMNTASLLRGQSIDRQANNSLWEQLTEAVPETDIEIRSTREATLRQTPSDAAQDLAGVVVGGRGDTTGCFLINTESYTRRIVIDWPEEIPLPAPAESIIAGPTNSGQRSLVVEVPPCGFVWLPCGDGATPKPAGKNVPMAEGNILRNEFFEVQINEVTGGIGQLKTYRRGPKRLSQQLAFRFPREQTVTVGEGEDAVKTRTWYSEMRLAEMQIISPGPVSGEIVTTGDLINPSDDSVIADYRQSVRVWRGIPTIEVNIELDTKRLPEGDPWSNFYATRWAWNDSTATLTCSVQEGAHPMSADRIEAPHFIEIADGDFRTTIHPVGLPFHRKTGPRMIDSLLIVACETKRQFRFVVSVDEQFPMEVSRTAFNPAEPVVLTRGPKQSTSGWFFHVDAHNVQITQLLPPSAANENSGVETSNNLKVCVRLRETEGRHRKVRLNCFRSPASARQCDFLGNTITDLSIDDDTVVVDVTAFEICDIEIRFAEL
ncbi:MAG: hypothetical protein R3C02_18095 [Planctomycetaceae bacterium]